MAQPVPPPSHWGKNFTPPSPEEILSEGEPFNPHERGVATLFSFLLMAPMIGLFVSLFVVPVGLVYGGYKWFSTAGSQFWPLMVSYGKVSLATSAAMGIAGSVYSYLVELTKEA